MSSTLPMLAVALVIAGAASAHPGVAGETSTYVDGDGRSWRAEQNRHGAMLASGRDRLYLGRSCDARSPRWGRGRWGWANGGVLITFPGRRIGFARQEPPVPDARCPL